MPKSGYFSRISQSFKQWFKTRVAPCLLGGWRTAALVNTILITIVSALMIAFSAVGLTEAGGFNRPLVFFDGACAFIGASGLNAALHILINIISTAILASSNMFMQVLNAPTRGEVDRSHKRGSWLEIGVLSWRNVFRLSPFKTVAWLGFFTSSIPVHLLFNSAVFQASYKFSKYDLAIVSDPFLYGGKYFTPGASLLNSGGLTVREYIPNSNEARVDISPDLLAGYGDFVNLTEYRNSTSWINKRISSIAQTGHSWRRITKKECRQEYVTCSGLSAHSDVILVVSDTQGWRRRQVWNLTEERNSFWDTYVPDDISEPEPNSLWFYGRCKMSAYSEFLTLCGNSCRWALGGSFSTQDWVLPFYPINSPETAAIMSPNYPARWNEPSIYSPKENDLDIAYCLARPVRESCKVALSTTLLVCVTGCAIFKMTLCVLVYCRLRRQNPFATPGDAINSFISEPDPYTAGMSLLSQGEVRMSFLCGTPQPGPRKYRQRKRRLVASVPSSEWVFLIVVMITAFVGAVFLITVTRSIAGGITGGFGADSANPLTLSGTSLLTAVLIANSPQLALSATYVIYNNMFTRLLVGRAWALMSTKHTYLRVTDAKGSQRSTYRLQLPYRYSIPFIIVSALLHWLMSNTIYIFISQGDYFERFAGSGPNSSYSDPNLPPGSTVSVGYSLVALAILAFGLLFSFLMPFIWSLRRLPGPANSVGCNSFAISASCHVSTLSRPDPEPDVSKDRVPMPSSENRNSDENEMELLSPDQVSSAGDPEETRLRKIAQSRLRWGVVEMPPGWSSQYTGTHDQVGHISFGTTNDEVGDPVNDHWYA